MAKLRRSQEERRRETCVKLRSATIELIAERGYVNTTTTDISKRAGVSRGALLHHYPAKIDLIVDAAREMWRHAIVEVRNLSDALDAGHLDIDAFVEGVWSRAFQINFVNVALDLMSAARSDQELAERVSEPLDELFAAYDEIADQAFAKSGLSKNQRRVVVSLTTSTIRGLKFQEMMHPDPALAEAVRDALKTMLKQVLGSTDTISLLPEPALRRRRSRTRTKRAATS